MEESACWHNDKGKRAGNLADAEPRQRFARGFWRESRRATPRLHPSRGECRHTVHVIWRVPFVVDVVVGEVASSRA